MGGRRVDVGRTLIGQGPRPGHDGGSGTDHVVDQDARTAVDVAFDHRFLDLVRFEA